MITRSVLVSSLMLFLALPAFAAEVRGLITKVNPQTKELSVEGRGIGVRGQSFTFQLLDDTQIRFGKQPAEFGDLPVGRNVQVYFELKDGKRIAHLVNVSGARPRPATTASEGNVVRGVLRRVGYTDREIVVILPPEAGLELETTLAVPDNVKIVRDRKPISFDDLKEGEQVVVRTEKRETGLVAASIQIGEGAEQPQPQENNIAKIRKILKTVDFFLQMAEQFSK